MSAVTCPDWCNNHAENDRDSVRGEHDLWMRHSRGFDAEGWGEAVISVDEWVTGDGHAEPFSMSLWVEGQNLDEVTATQARGLAGALVEAAEWLEAHA